MALEQRIDSLKKRHAQLKKLVQEKESCYDKDPSVLHHLKSMKLNLKDEIERLLQGRSGEAA